MELGNDLGETAIQDVIVTHPVIGEILARFDIGCVTCKVGICLLKDVVSIHGLSKDDEARIATEINNYLATKGA
jgi:transcriptional regulator of NAD metabolism